MTWQASIEANRKPIPAGIKSQAKLPNGATYTVCESRGAQDACPVISYMPRSKKLTLQVVEI